jgi:hypothetical protein
LAVALLVPIAASALVACGEGEEPTKTSKSANKPAKTTGPDFGELPAAGEVTVGQLNECASMDLVFIVDNSGSMEEEQTNLAENFPRFASIIDGYRTANGQPLDYRLAVTTTDATNGKGAFVKDGTPPKSGGFQFPPQPSRPACDGGPDRRWLERLDPNVVNFFACRAQVGTGGSANEQPLGALLLGLTDRIADGTNTANGASFLRDEALLAFVILTDEDERSASSGSSQATLPKTAAEFASAFDKLKGGDRKRWAGTVIAGEQACSSPKLGQAEEAKELKSFIAEAGTNGTFSSICTGDLTDGLTKALATFDLACKSFPGPK